MRGEPGQRRGPRGLFSRPGARPELLPLLLSSVRPRGAPEPGGFTAAGVTPCPRSLRGQTQREELLFSGTWDKKQLTLNKFLLKVRVLGLLKVQNNVKKEILVFPGLERFYEKPVTVIPVFFQTFLPSTCSSKAREVTLRWI